MFCNQCEQTAKGTGCTVVGVCGKSADVAAIQDQLVYLLRRLAALVLKARSAGIVDTDTDDFMVEALFGTLTNVNFDPQALRRMEAGTLERAKALAARLGDQPEDLNLSPEDYPARLPESVVGIDRFSTDGDVASAMQLLLFGLKGVAAYADHAARLGRRDPELSAFICKALVAGSPWDEEVRDLGGWLELVLECGKANLRAMELLETLLALEQTRSGAWTIAAGRCELCARCARRDGLPCRNPERMRYSFSAFGFDLAALARQELGIELLWAANGLPEYDVALAAFLER